MFDFFNNGILALFHDDNVNKGFVLRQHLYHVVWITKYILNPVKETHNRFHNLGTFIRIFVEFYRSQIESHTQLGKSGSLNKVNQYHCLHIVELQQY
jgi:hypothetical protein